MSTRQTPEPDEVFWAGYAERLTARLDSEQRHRQSALRKRRSIRLSYPMWRIGVIAALVLMGIFLGKLIWTQEHPSEPLPHATDPNPSQANAASVLVDNRVQSYLQKSKVLLLALANFDPHTDDAITLNLHSQKRISESLVQEAAYLKTALADPAETRLRELISDLEIILLQIANLEDEHDLEAVEMVQRGVNKRGVLFRIDLSKISNERRDTSSRTKRNPQNRHQT
jgi:hypothetical protein